MATRIFQHQQYGLLYVFVGYFHLFCFFFFAQVPIKLHGTFVLFSIEHMCVKTEMDRLKVKWCVATAHEFPIRIVAVLYINFMK